MRENLPLGSPTKSVTNWAVQPQKMATGVEGLYYLSSASDQRLCFCISKSWLSYDEAHFLVENMRSIYFAKLLTFDICLTKVISVFDMLYMFYIYLKF